MPADSPTSAAPVAIVLGAGLAGACAAHALALAGHKVVVLDRAAEPATAGASALPVGLMALRKNAKAERANPEAIAWDAEGMAATRALLEKLTAQGLLQHGRDWQACGTWQLDKNAGSYDYQAEACWIKPAALVAACLQHPNIQFAGGQTALAINAEGAQWQVSTQDQVWRHAHTVVMAAAVDCTPLIAGLQAEHNLGRIILNTCAGQVLMGDWQAQDADCLPHDSAAYNGSGHFMPAVPTADGGAFWLSGATYVEGTRSRAAIAQDADTEDDWNRNKLRLAELLPNCAPQLLARTEALHTWAGVRCTTPTRLPMVRELAPGLWLSTGFGSRGLSYAPLAAERLAASVQAAI